VDIPQRAGPYQPTPGSCVRSRAASSFNTCRSGQSSGLGLKASVPSSHAPHDARVPGTAYRRAHRDDIQAGAIPVDARSRRVRLPRYELSAGYLLINELNVQQIIPVRAAHITTCAARLLIAGGPGARALSIANSKHYTKVATTRSISASRVTRRANGQDEDYSPFIIDLAM
jgi:hypothetical protein